MILMLSQFPFPVIQPLFREPNVWPEETDLEPNSKNFQAVLQNGFKIRMKLASKLVEEIAAGLRYPQFVELFKEAEFSSFYLKKYTEREEK